MSSARNTMPKLVICFIVMTMASAAMAQAPRSSVEVGASTGAPEFRDPKTGHLIKQEFGAWMLPDFRMLAKLKRLRGTKLDVFGYTKERKIERALIGEYEALIAELLGGLTAANHALAVRLASVPDDIKGYGHIKDAHLEKARRKQAELLHQWRNPQAMKIAAE